MLGLDLTCLIILTQVSSLQTETSTLRAQLAAAQHDQQATHAEVQGLKQQLQVSLNHLKPYMHDPHVLHMQICAGVVLQCCGPECWP